MRAVLFWTMLSASSRSFRLARRCDVQIEVNGKKNVRRWVAHEFDTLEEVGEIGIGLRVEKRREPNPADLTIGTDPDTKQHDI